MEQPQKQAIRSHLGPHVKSIREVFDTIKKKNETGKKRSRTEPWISVVPAFSMPLSDDRKNALRLVRSKTPAERSEIRQLLKSGDEQVVAAGRRLRNIDDEYGSRHITWPYDVAGMLEERHPLLFNTNPWFASEHPELVAKRIGKVAAIIRKLKRARPNEVVGVNIYGSTVRGYMNGGSDLDYAFIGSDSAAFEFYEKLRKSGIEPCEKRSDTLNPDNPNPHRLFSGLFVGDKDQLRKLQVKAITAMDPYDWKRVVSTIEMNEGSLDKLKAQRGIHDIFDTAPSYPYVNAGLKRIPSDDWNEVIKAMKAHPGYKKYF